MLIFKQCPEFVVLCYVVSVVKKTNSGRCQNGNIECPQRYKHSTNAANMRRALTHCSEWKHIHNEIKRETATHEQRPKEQLHREMNKRDSERIKQYCRETSRQNGKHQYILQGRFFITLQRGRKNKNHEANY